MPSLVGFHVHVVDVDARLLLLLLLLNSRNEMSMIDSNDVQEARVCYVVVAAVVAAAC